MNIIPTVLATWYPRLDGFDASGLRQLGAGIQTMIHVVYAKSASNYTEKNAAAAEAGVGTTATRENVGQLVCLMIPQLAVKLGDKITVSSANYRIASIQYRYTVFGSLDHHEVTANPWS